MGSSVTVLFKTILFHNTQQSVVYYLVVKIEPNLKTITKNIAITSNFCRTFAWLCNWTLLLTFKSILFNYGYETVYYSSDIWIWRMSFVIFIRQSIYIFESQWEIGQLFIVINKVIYNMYHLNGIATGETYSLLGFGKITVFRLLLWILQHFRLSLDPQKQDWLL